MKSIPAIYQFILMVVGIGTATVFIYRWADKQQENDAVIMETLAEVQETLIYINTEQTFIAEDIQGVHDTLERMENANNARGQKIETLAWGLKHMKQFTPDQFEDILDEMLKKNERLNMNPVTLPREESIHCESDPELILSNMR